MEEEKKEIEICHVCKREKKPYIVLITNNIMEHLNYKQAREDGPICERCNTYHAMTGEFKDATDKEHENARKACNFALLVAKWWEKDKKLDYEIDIREENKRDWPGTHDLRKWCRGELNVDKI